MEREIEREMGRTREYRSSVPLAFDIDKHIGGSILIGTVCAI